MDNTQVHRANCVLNEFERLPRAAQLDVCEAAIVWAFAALGTRQEQPHCEGNFLAFVDVAYVQTEFAGSTLNESESRRIWDAAVGAAKQSEPIINNILRASAQAVLGLEKDCLFRTLGEKLHNVRTTFMQHASGILLRELTVKCVEFCQIQAARNSELRGLASLPVVLQSDFELAACAKMVESDVYQAIEQGRLAVRDGRIIDLSGRQGA